MKISVISAITGISIAGVAWGVAALIVVLSVMNGFYDIVRELLVSLDPHVRIVSAEGRGIAAPDTRLEQAAALLQVEERGGNRGGDAIAHCAGCRGERAGFGHVRRICRVNVVRRNIGKDVLRILVGPHVFRIQI